VTRRQVHPTPTHAYKTRNPTLTLTLSAWKAIGEVDGVDAFKRKTEITHITKTGDELERELRETIEQLKGKTVEGEHEIVEDD
jgi:uncharacterized protein (UPF0218 family)